MVNSTFNQPKTDKPDYPLLIQLTRKNEYETHKENPLKLVILTTGKTTGTIVYSNHEDYPIGYYSINWDFKESVWELKFLPKGYQITLTQQ